MERLAIGATAPIQQKPGVTLAQVARDFGTTPYLAKKAVQAYLDPDPQKLEPKRRGSGRPFKPFTFSQAEVDQICAKPTCAAMAGMSLQ